MTAMAQPSQGTNKALLTKVITGEVRLSYAHLFKPVAISEGQEEKYSVCILIPKSDTATVRKIEAAIEAAKAAGLTSRWNGKLPRNLKLPLRDGDEERSEQPEYHGCHFLNATSKQRPGIVDAQVQQIINSEEVYSGCYGRVSINFFAFSTAGNNGIACGLNNVQKLRDGEYLGGRANAEDDFADGEADDDMLG